MQDTLEVLCAHQRIAQYKNKEDVVIFEVCATCGLSAETPPLVAGPGELLPWWDHKPAAKIRIDAARPGINRLHDLRDGLKAEAEFLRQLIDLAYDMGDGSASMFEDELAEVEERQRATQVPWGAWK